MSLGYSQAVVMRVSYRPRRFEGVWVIPNAKNLLFSVLLCEQLSSNVRSDRHLLAVLRNRTVGKRAHTHIPNDALPSWRWFIWEGIRKRPHSNLVATERAVRLKSVGVKRAKQNRDDDHSESIE